MADIVCKNAKHSLNTIVITQLSLLREHENLDVQLVSHGQASESNNESNSLKLALVVLHDLRSTSTFEESIELLVVDVVEVLVEKSIRNIRVKYIGLQTKLSPRYVMSYKFNERLNSVVD